MSSSLLWPRAIMLVDMNAFFASIEQYDFPELRGKPVGVTNGEIGTCVITCSYEARRCGVKTGMRLPEAYQLCPDLIQRASRPYRYVEISKQIIAALAESISPDLEVYSIDEAFLDVTHLQQYVASPEQLAHQAHQLVYEVSGLTCSVGVSGCKTSAKYAANLVKPNAVTVIPPWQAAARLADVPVTDIWGINKGIADFLARYGAYTCGDVANMPVTILAKRFGNLGRRMWLQCQGKDPLELETKIPAPKSMGHGKVVPPNTTDLNTIYIFYMHMADKLSKRLRANGMRAQYFAISARTRFGRIGRKFKTICPTHEARDIFKKCKQFIEQSLQNVGVSQIQVTALMPIKGQGQLDLFEDTDEDCRQALMAMDAVNERYGSYTMVPARLLNRSSMPDVIAPSWRPKGHRKSV